MSLRLFLVDMKGCHHITKLMPGIMAVYQMAAEFNPHLMVEFLPNKGEGSNITNVVILLSKASGGTIKKEYDFTDPSSIKDLRKLIWKELLKNKKITNIANKDGTLTDFRQTEVRQVTQGWQAAKRKRQQNTCCKIHPSNTVTPPKFKDQQIKHQVYQVNNTTDIKTKKQCIKSRLTECRQTHPINSQLFKRCADEVNWLCNNGYPINKHTNAVIKAHNKLSTKLHNHLKQNNTKVNKKTLDTILSNGFFDHINNRMGNKYSSYMRTEHFSDKSINIIILIGLFVAMIISMYNAAKYL